MDNGPIDDNSHGTHCAAIAVANHDTIGIAGIAPNAKYLPMKGLESSGGSTSSVLSQCVTYSANNGADILSMSFGGYGRSFVLENALSYAYAFSMPVGAAGNDGICIRNDGQLCPDGTPPAPNVSRRVYICFSSTSNSTKQRLERLQSVVYQL
jgi:thermitase